VIGDSIFEEFCFYDCGSLIRRRSSLWLRQSTCSFGEGRVVEIDIESVTKL
jgi:hypothetical protein